MFYYLPPGHLHLRAQTSYVTYLENIRRHHTALFLFRRVRKISKSNYQLRHVRLSSRYKSTSTGRNLMKFYI